MEEVSILRKRQGEMLYDNYLKKDNIMVKCNKVTIIIYLIMIVTCLSIKYSYSQEKPSDRAMKDIIFLLEKSVNSLPMYIKHVKINNFVITNSFISNINGRYCVEINLDISYMGRKRTIDDFEFRNEKLINKRYSFKKIDNQWYGWRGWGPGED